MHRPGVVALLDAASVHPAAAVVTVSPESLADKSVDTAQLAARLDDRLAKLTVITTAYIASVPGGAELLAADAGEKP
ncbi:hypothetical protein [Amycolatopsis sp. WGS_07]|uniref:hypothetical protein n=1 Tax=Amycolatopsis sp. WGS_07 TaxID=3076764 RepID=UPI0038730A58